MLRRTARMATSFLTQPAEHVGASGLRYRFKHLIQQRPHLGRVWIAQAGAEHYLLKDVPESYFKNFDEDIRPRLHDHPNLRVPVDTIPNQYIYVYEYLSDELFSLAKAHLPDQTKKGILKGVLQGLHDLHQKGIVHLDVKPDNVVIDCRRENEEVLVSKVQVTDLENSVWLPPGKNVEGMLAGNENWRSPEAHMRARLHKPTNMFSFGIMCIYAMLGRVIFGQDYDFAYQESQGNMAAIIRLQRQISFFGDEQGFYGFLKLVGNNELRQMLTAMWEDRHEATIPYKHFSTWPEVKDENFRDLVLKMTNLDPDLRITARQALQHPWFAMVDAW